MNFPAIFSILILLLNVPLNKASGDSNSYLEEMKKLAGKKTSGEISSDEFESRRSELRKKLFSSEPTDQELKKRSAPAKARPIEPAQTIAPETVIVIDQAKVIAKTFLTVREHPLKSAKMLGMLKPGDTVSVTEVTNNSERIEGRDGKWVKVSASGVDGYVFDGYLQYASAAAVQNEQVWVDSKSKESTNSQPQNQTAVNRTGSQEIGTDGAIIILVVAVFVLSSLFALNKLLSYVGGNKPSQRKESSRKRKIIFEDKESLEKTKSTVNDRSEKETVGGEIRPLSGNNLSNTYQWNGKELRPLSGEARRSWEFKKDELRPIIGATGSNSYLWDGKELRPKINATSSNSYIWNGRELKRKSMNQLEETWSFDGKEWRKLGMTSLANTYQVKGDIPVPVCALVILKLV